jgi:hypothetical protein
MATQPSCCLFLYSSSLNSSSNHSGYICDEGLIFLQLLHILLFTAKLRENGVQKAAVCQGQTRIERLFIPITGVWLATTNYKIDTFLHRLVIGFYPQSYNTILQNLLWLCLD